MSNGIFNKLCNEFNIAPEEIAPAAVVDDTDKKIKEISNNISNQKYDLEDKEYIKTELQTLIATNQTVLQGLADQLKIGSQPQFYAAFISLSKTISDQIMNLVDLQKKITDYRVTESAENIRIESLKQRERLATMRINKASGPATLTQNNTYNLNSSESLDMIQKIIEQKKLEQPQTTEVHPDFNLE